MKSLRYLNRIILLIMIVSAAEVQAQDDKKKVDGVVAVVGDFFILESDIDKTFVELQAQGNSIKGITRCELLGKLLEDKLYAHHAVQDSIPVADSEVQSLMDNQINYMMDQLGSMDKVVEYFKKSSEAELKSELTEIIKMNKLSTKMQEKVVSGVEITPEETKQFFNGIDEEDIPVFGAELELAQIVIKPEITQEDKDKVIKKLNTIRKDVLENGASFTSKAVLYSEDPGSRSDGGFYKMTKKTPFVKEFKDVAFSMAEGEISEPFETEFGYHIIYLEKIRGRELDLRHILLMPAISNQALREAKEKIDLIRKRIINNEISFEEAAREFSDEKETRNNGGVLINPKTFTTRFELTKMDPTLYSQVVNLKNDEVSYPLIDQDRSGRKFYKIIKVTNSTEEHKADYARDYARIRELALKEKQIKAIQKWSKEKIEETYIKVNGAYKNCTFKNNWLKKE